MPNPVIDELTQLAPRIKAALETERQADQARRERLQKAEAVLLQLRSGLDTIAAELAATIGEQAAVGDDATATDRTPRGSRSEGGGRLEWSGACRLALVVGDRASGSLECVAGARLYDDGELQLVACHFVNRQQVWFGERMVAVGSAEQATSAAGLMDELNVNLPAATRQLCDRLLV